MISLRQDDDIEFIFPTVLGKQMFSNFPTELSSSLLNPFDWSFMTGE
jgi:hypothetical protein